MPLALSATTSVLPSLVRSIASGGLWVTKVSVLPRFGHPLLG